MDYHDLPRLLTLMTGDEKHTASATSTLDVLWVLYDRVLRIDPAQPDASDRDRFFLSKGHGPMAYYAVLAAKGFVPEAELPNFGSYRSVLGQHPDRTLVPGVEIGSGSLGHGLPIAVGSVLGLRARRDAGNALETAANRGGPPSGLPPLVYCLVGDAELDEGSNHEAIAFAGRLGLWELTVVVVDNQSATYGWPGGIARRFELEGWSAVEVNGRDHEAIARALRRTGCGAFGDAADFGDGAAPHAIVARVEKKG